MNRKEKEEFSTRLQILIGAFVLGSLITGLLGASGWSLKLDEAYQSGYLNASQNFKMDEFKEVSFITVHPENRTYTVIECVNSTIKFDNNRIYCEVSK